MIPRLGLLAALLLSLPTGALAQDEKAELEALREGASKGDPRSQRKLGQAFQFGTHGLPVNWMRAVELYHLAAEKDEPMAINNLGQIYGHEGEKFRVLHTFYNVGKSMDLLRKAAELDVPHAHSTLAETYCWGRKRGPTYQVRENADLAMQHAREALRLGEKHRVAHGIGMGHLVIGELQFRSKEYQKAVASLENSLKAKETVGARRRLAECYRDGLGVSENLKKAATHAEALMEMRPNDEAGKTLLEDILRKISQR